MTMTLVSTVTVGSGGAASIDFTSIPQGATDICILLSTRDTYGGGSYGWTLNFTVNGSATGYTQRRLLGDGSAASNTSTGTTSFGSGGKINVSADATTNTFSNVSVYFPNYSGSTAKPMSFDGVGENNATNAAQGLVAGLWNNTSGITSISFRAGGSTFAQYSTASLYTITKGTGGATVS